jgi:hypothetical protein
LDPPASGWVNAISIRMILAAGVRVILHVCLSAGCVAQDRRADARSIVEHYFAAVGGSA